MFRLVVFCAIGTLVAIGTSNPTYQKGTDRAMAVAAVLDDWHKAAAAADEERYFSHFTQDAIMMGTDASEHWTRDEFRAWAKPHFDQGKGWSFKASKRHLNFSQDGSVAWFDELLDTAQLGVCRGSGVLVLDADRWKIAQYNLSVPIPNGVFAEVKKVIDAVSKSDREKKCL